MKIWRSQTELRAFSLMNLINPFMDISLKIYIILKCLNSLMFLMKKFKYS